MKKLLCLAFAVIMVLSVLVGCSSEKPAATAEPAPQSGTTAESTGGVKKGGTLRFYMDEDPTSLDNTRTRLFVELPFYDTILTKNNDGTYSCRLIESYEQDAEAKTYTLHMKDTPVLFHDGSEMTAEVLAWNINQYKEIGFFASSFNKIDRAEATDDKTVVIYMNEWDLLIPYSLTRMCAPVSKEFVEKNGWDALNENECGTGPFMLKEWKRGDRIECVKFPQYHRGEPNIDEVHYVAYPSPEVALLAFENNEIDVLDYFSFDYNQLDALKARHDLTVYEGKNDGTAKIIGFCCTNPEDPFYDVRVRKAVCYAIDTDTIAKALTSGFYYPGGTQWSPTGYKYCSPNVTGFEFDQAKAKELLAEAGYPNGFKTTMTLQTGSEPRAVLVQAMLKEVGIDVELITLDRANFDKYISGWESGILMHGGGVANGQEYQLTNSARSDVPTGFGANSFIHTQELDDLCAKGLSSSAEDSYAPIQRVAEIMFQEDVDMYVLYLDIGIVIAQPYVKDIEIYKDVKIDAQLHTAWIDK